VEDQSYKAILAKMEKVQALYLRPGSEGEKQAAVQAMLKLQKKLSGIRTYQKIRKYEAVVFD